jgi:uncharacterized membrane protein YbhN (UPF0104 family)
MAHVLKDFITGGVLVVASLLAGLAVLIVFFILGIFLHIFAALASAFFFLALIVAAVWFVGYAYRRMKEIKKK